MRKPIVLVGGGLASAKAAATLRAKGYDGDVVVVGEEPRMPYERPNLTKEYLRRESGRNALFPKPGDWYEANGIDLRLGTSALALDVAERTIALSDGTTLGYDQVLLATGSRARMAGIEGEELEGVVSIRTVADSDLLRAMLLDAVARREGRVAIIGDGWIGLEVAASARRLGADVTILGRGDVPLARTLGRRLGEFYRDLQDANGVGLLANATATRLHGSDGRVTGVEVAGGAVLPADVVLIATGAVPNVGIAATAGLELRARELGGGIAVDATLAAGAPGVFAAGDVASVPSPHYGRPVRVDHWAVALRTGPHAARAMLGDREPYRRLPYFYSDQYDTSMEFAGFLGDPAGVDPVVVGSTEQKRFVAVWLDGDRVVAGLTMNVADRIAGIEELITTRRSVDRAELDAMVG